MNRNASKAFTIVEMLVGMVILAILVIFLSGIANSISSTWARQQALAEARQSSRAIIDMITRDLRAAAQPVDPNDQSGLQFLQMQAGTAGAVGDDFKNPHAAFWQAPLASDASAGDLAIVGYFIRWTTAADDGRPVGRLCRLLIEPERGSPLPVYTTPLDWVDEGLLEFHAPAGPDADDLERHYRGLVAENVVALWFNCHTQSLSLSAGAVPGFDSRQVANLPRFVDVSFAMLDSATARRFNEGERQRIVALAASAGDAAEFIELVRAQGDLVDVARGLQVFNTSVQMENHRPTPSPAP